MAESEENMEELEKSKKKQSKGFKIFKRVLFHGLLSSIVVEFLSGILSYNLW